MPGLVGGNPQKARTGCCLERLWLVGQGIDPLVRADRIGHPVTDLVPFGQWSAGQKLGSQPRQGPEIPDINLIQDVLAELGTNRKLPSQGGSDQMTKRARLDVLRTG